MSFKSKFNECYGEVLTYKISVLNSQLNEFYLKHNISEENIELFIELKKLFDAKVLNEFDYEKLRFLIYGYQTSIIEALAHNRRNFVYDESREKIVSVNLKK